AALPGWSARIWPLLPAGVLLAGPVLNRLLSCRLPLPDSLLVALTFRRGEPVSPPQQVILWVLHLAGLWLWARSVELPWLCWPVLGLAVLAGQWWVSRRAGLSPWPDALPLTPLFAAYLSAALHLWLSTADPPLPVPVYPPLSQVWWWFEPVGTAAAAGTYALLVNLSLLRPSGVSPRLAAPVIAGSGLVWMAAELLVHRTRGVTGTDPYGYTQVAVDLATHGTPLHRFGLFPYLADLPLAWAPVIVPGYHLPLNPFGDAASVWPPGASVLLAVGHRLAGEAGLYLTIPLLALLAAGAVGWLAVEAGQRLFPAKWMALAGGLSVLVWATSYEVIDRSLVPMADIPAALFTALAWIFLLRARRGGLRVELVNGLAAGLALGLAFDMRYTQLLLVASVIVAAWRPRWRPGLVLAAGMGALLAAGPDIGYRWWVFGGPLANPQGRELIHFAPAHIPLTLVRMGQALLHGREFGLLWPFTLLGLARHYHRDRRGFWILVAGALAVAGAQLPYEALRLRDWLALLALPAVWTGWGWVAAWRWLVGQEPRTRQGQGLVALAIFALLFLPAARVRPLVARSFVPHRASFGYVSAGQRAALAQITALTSPRSAVGVAFNGGAVTLHSRRWAFYPAGWSAAELELFLARMAEDSIPVYLLDDGPALEPVIKRLAGQGRLQAVTRLDVPLPDDGGSGWLFRVK
ncbi:MAG: hypothetical protein D6784_01940, partial [Chloroflexi bacterium]